MNAPAYWRGLRALTIGVAMLIAAGGTLSGQDADFLFDEPKMSIGLIIGFAGASAGSEIFDWTRSELTVEKGDFSSGLLGVELGIRASDRVDITFGGGVAKSEARSEYRDWLGADDLPIEQTTSFRRVPFSASLKYYLRPRGRSIGRFAWVPGDWSPYLGVGGGWTLYRFQQSGEWIDFETEALDIFRGTVVSEGSAPTVHLLAGVQKSLNPHFVLSGEGRYAWASTAMDLDFEGFDEIDLGGFQLTVGISARF